MNTDPRINQKVLIVVSEFNRIITQSLLAGAVETLYKAGFPATAVKVRWVPGAFELPFVAAKGAESADIAAVICLGCVIRGETPHFDYVCQETARGLMEVGLRSKKPVIFGVITTDNAEQAMTRSGMTPMPAGASAGIKQLVPNKGVDAAEAAIKMLTLLAEWESDHGGTHYELSLE